MSSMSSMSSTSRLQRLKMFVSQRLTAAVDDILRHLDTTMTEYEEELQRRHQALLNERQHTDVQQLLLRKEEVQQCCPHVDQEDPKAPHIKKEEEELWSCQGGGQFQGPEASDVMFLSSPVSAKSEDDEEKPPVSSWTEHVGTDVGVEDSGGPGPARTSDPDPYLLPVSDDKVSNSSEAETELSDDDKERGGAQPGRSIVTDNKCPTAKKSFMCCECGRKFGRKDSLRRHMRFHTGEKPYSCSICSKRFSQRPNLIRHMRCHSGEKPFGCSFCDASFAVRSALVNHMRIHTGEKPFSCLYCEKSFAQKGGLKKHMTVHTGEKPYSCPACDKSFSQKANLTYHFSVHTGQKQFSCSACKKRFTWQSQVKSHKCVGGNGSS